MRRRVVTRIIFLLLIIITFIFLVFINFQSEEINTEQILLKQAEKENIKVTDEEIEEEIVSFLDFSETDREQLDNYLEEKDVTVEEFHEDIEKKVKIKKLLNKEIDIDSVTVTDREIDSYLGAESDLDYDDPLISAIREQAADRLLYLKQGILIKQYMEGLE